MASKSNSKFTKKHKNNMVMVIGIAVFAIVVLIMMLSGGKSSNVPAAKSNIAAPSKLNPENNKSDPKLKKLINEQNNIESKGKYNFAPRTLDVPTQDKPDTKSQIDSLYTPPAEDVNAAPQNINNEQAANPMMKEMSSLLTSWVPGKLPTTVVFAKKETLSTPTGVTGSGGTDTTKGATTPTPAPATQDQPVRPADIRAGEILYAEVVTDINSDDPGPVLLNGLSKKIRGMRVIANGYTVNDISLTIEPTTLVTPVDTIPVDTFVVNEQTARTSVFSSVDHHYLSRWGSFIITGVLSDIGQVMSSQGRQTITTSTAGGILQSSNTVLTPSQEGWIIAGRTADRLASVGADYINRPNTVYLHQGETVGLLFMSDVWLPQ